MRLHDIRRREIRVLREEIPVAEAARAIGIEERSVLRIAARIRKKLAEKLEPLVQGWRTPAPA